MIWNKQEMDIKKATLLVKEYFKSVHDNLGLLAFKVESVNKNTEPGIWKVHCSFYPSVGSSKRSYYLVRVNVTTGIMDVKETNEK